MHRFLAIRVATCTEVGQMRRGLSMSASLCRMTMKERPLNRRQKMKKAISDIPNVNRSSKVHELHRRLAEYERLEAEGGHRQTEKEGDSMWKVESEAAERMIRANPEYFATIHAAREKEKREIEKKKQANEEKLQKEATSYPFRAEESVQESVEHPSSSYSPSTSTSSSIPQSDHGFFVSGDMYVDEYTAATTADLPEDEMTVGSRWVYGDDDAVETIDFQLPGQAVSEMHERERALAEGEDVYDDDVEGSLEMVKSERQCGGCGAHFHCHDDSLPGYLPPILLAREEKKARKRTAGDPALCKRCHLLKHHRFLPNVNVCPVDYATMLSKLRGRQEVLILLVVDILDLPGSIHRALPSIIGAGKPMVVVANKVDLLPPDAKCGYLKRFKQTVDKAITEAGFRHSFNILHTALVSAKTGYGIEDLITELHMKWTNVKSSMRDDIYLVGCTNAGKSTLFNTLLQSDLCKVRAVDLVERATTSVWPGTTLSLLKFPVMRPSAMKLELRRRRLIAHKAWMLKEAYARKRSLQRTGDTNLAVLVEPVINTYKEREDDLQPRAMASFLESTNAGVEEWKDEDEEEGEEGRRVRGKRIGRPWSLNDPVFQKGVWCYDTPGTVNEEQILDKLSLRELVNVVPNRLLRPRTAIVSPGRSLLIGGLARLDIVRSQDQRPIYVTVFAHDSLPLNSIRTVEVNEFLESNKGREALGAPLGDTDRLSRLRPMEKRIFEIREQQREKKHWEKDTDSSLVGLADVVFSSIGWATVSTHSEMVEVAAWIPGGQGLDLREPLLPYAVLLRGARIPGTAFYKVKTPEFPVNIRRLNAEKNRRKFRKGGRGENEDWNNE